MADERIEVDVVVNAENVDQLNSVVNGLNSLNTSASSVGSSLSNGTNSIRNFVNGFVNISRGVLSVNNSINQVSRRMRVGLSGIHNMWVSGLRTTVREVKNLTKEAIENYTELTKQHAKTTGVIANSGSYNLNTNKGMARFQRDSESLKQQSINMARTGSTGRGSLYTATQISEAQTELVKAGIPVKAILNDGVLQEILTFAQANDIKTANAVQFATALGSQFKVDYKDWGDMLDKVSHTADLSPIGVSDVVQSMKYAGGIASGLDRSMSEVLGQVAMMGDFGLRASQAGSAIQALYSRILTGDTTVITEAQAEVAPPNALKAFYDFSKFAKSDGSGLTYEQIQNADTYEKLGEISGNLRPMDEIVDQLDEVISTMNDEEQAWFIKKFFGLYQMKGAYALMSDEGDKSLLDYQNDIENNSIGTNENKLNQLLDSDYGKQTTLENLIDVTKTDVGEKLSPLTNQIRGELFNFINERGNYDIDYDSIRDALGECSDAIAKQYGDAIGNLTEKIGNTVIDLVEVGENIAPELADGISNIISDIADFDPVGVVNDWNTMISNLDTSVEGLPEDLQELGNKVNGLIETFGILIAMDIGSRVLETVSNVVKIIQIAGGAVIRAGSVIVNGGMPGGTPVPTPTSGGTTSSTTNTSNTVANAAAATAGTATASRRNAAPESTRTTTTRTTETTTNKPQRVKNPAVVGERTDNNESPVKRVRRQVTKKPNTAAIDPDDGNQYYYTKNADDIHNSAKTTVPDNTTIVNLDGAEMYKTQDPNTIARHMNNPKIITVGEDSVGFNTTVIKEDPVVDGDMVTTNRTEITNKDGKLYKTENIKTRENKRTKFRETVSTAYRQDQPNDIIRTTLTSTDDNNMPHMSVDKLTGYEREEALRQTHITEGIKTSFVDNRQPIAQIVDADDIPDTHKTEPTKPKSKPVNTDIDAPDETYTTTTTTTTTTTEETVKPKRNMSTSKRRTPTEQIVDTAEPTTTLKPSETTYGLYARNTLGFVGGIGGGIVGGKVGQKLGTSFSELTGVNQQISEIVGSMTMGYAGSVAASKATNALVGAAIDKNAEWITKAATTKAGQTVAKALPIVGRAVGPAMNAAFAGYNIYKDLEDANTDNDKIHAVTNNVGGAVGSTLGGLGGMWAGAKAGALGGTLITPGVGTVIGTILGSIGGVLGGTYLGDQFGNILSSHETDYDALSKYIDEQRLSAVDTASKYAYKGNYNIAAIDYGNILSRVKDEDNEYNQDIKWYVPWSWNNGAQRSDAEDKAVSNFDRSYKSNIQSAELFYNVQQLLHDISGVTLEYQDYNDNAYKFKRYYEDYQENPDATKLSDYNIDSEVVKKFTIASESWASTFIDQVNENIRVKNQEIDATYRNNAKDDGKTGLLDTQLPVIYQHYNDVQVSPKKFNQEVTQGVMAYKDPTAALTANIAEFLNKNISTSHENKIGVEAMFPYFETLNGTVSSISSTTNSIFAKNDTPKNDASQLMGGISEVLNRQTSIESKVNALTTDKNTQQQLTSGVYAFKDPNQGLANNIREFIAGYESQAQTKVDQLQPQLETINGTANSILGKMDEKQSVSEILSEMKMTSEAEHVVENTLEQTIQINDQSNVNIHPITTPITVSPNISLTAHVDQSGNVSMTKSQQNSLFKMLTEFNVTKSRNYNVNK